MEQRVLVAAGATAGAVAACLLAHKLWVWHHDAATLQSHKVTIGPLSPAPQQQQQQQQQQQCQRVPVSYDYAQSVEELLIEAHLPLYVQQQDILVKFGTSMLLVLVDKQRLIDGQLAGRIVPHRCSWKIEGQGWSRKLSITLCKEPAAAGPRYTVWGSLLADGDALRSPEKRDQATK